MHPRFRQTRRRRPAGRSARLCRLVSGLAGLALLAVACSDAPWSDSATAERDQWTMLGHDLSSTYQNRAETELSRDSVSGLKLAWQLEARGTITGASAVADGVVYVLSSGGAYALRATDGSVLWQNPEIAGTSSPTLSEGTLFVNDSGSVVHALDAASGAERWQAVIDPHPNASGFSSPVAFERLVIVGSASFEEASARDSATFRGGVVAFDRESGAEVWRHYTVLPPYNGASVWSTVSIDPATRLLFASTGNNYTGQASDTSDAIFALHVDTGGLAWSRQLTEGDVFTILNPRSADTDFGTNPILFTARIDGRERELVGAGQKSGVFWALDRHTGELVWSRAVSPGSALAGGMLNNGAFDGRRILVAGNNGKSDAPGGEPSTGAFGAGTTSVLMALDPADGSTLWERQLGSFVWAPITVARDVGFVAVDQTLQAFDTATGEKLFAFETGGTIAAAPSVAGGRLLVGSGLAYFVGTPNRKLYALSLDGGGGGGGGGGPTFAPTFSAIWDEILVGRGCNTTSCHGAAAGDLALTSKAEAYASLVGTPAAGALCTGRGLTRVVPGEPGASLLLDKVDGSRRACGGPMPPVGRLAEAEVEQIRRWIERGAPDD